MERQTAAIQREKEAFQQEALDLAQRLDAVIHDKFIPKSHIDTDTPIDKTLNFLHAFVTVSLVIHLASCSVLLYVHSLLSVAVVNSILHETRPSADCPE